MSALRDVANTLVSLVITAHDNPGAGNRSTGTPNPAHRDRFTCDAVIAGVR
jgi:hypothetical protein